MTIHVKTLVLALSGLTLVACTPETELMRRYKSYAAAPATGTDPSVRVALFSLDKPDSQPKGLLDLSDRGQEKYIEIVGAKVASVGALQAALAESFEAPGPLGGDLGKIKRRLVLSVIDQNFGPADRLDRLEVNIQVKHANVSFTGWSLFATQYGEVDLGKATLAKSQSLEAKIDLLPPQVRELTGVSVTPKMSRDLTEELAVKRRYVALTGEIQRDNLKVLQQGATGIDLVGTSQIDVSLDLGDRIITPIYKFMKGDKTVPASLASARRLNPSLACDVKAEVTGKYRIRRVESGDSTSVEGDDVVTFITGEIGGGGVSTYTLLQASGLGDPGYVLKLSETQELHVLPPTRPDRPFNYETLSFVSADNAAQFVAWLKQEAARAGSGPRLDNHRFGVRDLGSLQVRAISLADAQNLYVVRGGRGTCQ